MIVNQVQIYLKAGNGGEGASTLMKLSPRKIIGGGGDGGDGGSVIIKVNPHYYDLSKFKMKKQFAAGDGNRGREYNKKGKAGKDLVLGVPKGTILKDLEGGVISDLNNEQAQYLICKGGKGGKGNYKRSYTTAAGSGQGKKVLLDYRICNDIALIGFPNSGKTSLFNALTGKAHKVADYPFTTTSPAWAEVEIKGKKYIVLDTPPLKRRLSKEKKGEENSFLKHLYRSRIILFISDDFNLCRDHFIELKEEISQIDESLIKNKKSFHLLTKIDKIDKTDQIDRINGDNSVLAVSVEKDAGLDILKKKILEYIGF